MPIKNGDKSAMPTHDVFEDCGIDGNSGPHLTQTTSYGLTKREIMAMHMMSGILCGCVSSGIARDSKDAENIAKAATLAADALLAELERTK